MTVARDPKLWIIPLIVGLLSGSGGGAGWNYLRPPQAEPAGDYVLEYRVSQCEQRGTRLAQGIASLRAKVDSLPPPDWREKINNIEQDVRKISDAMIRLEQHGHPELQYEPAKD